MFVFSVLRCLEGHKESVVHALHPQQKYITCHNLSLWTQTQPRRRHREVALLKDRKASS